MFISYFCMQSTCLNSEYKFCIILCSDGFSVNSVFKAFVLLLRVHCAHVPLVGSSGTWHQMYIQNIFSFIFNFQYSLFEAESYGNNRFWSSLNCLKNAIYINLISALASMFLQGLKRSVYCAKWYILKSSLVGFV